MKKYISAKKYILPVCLLLAGLVLLFLSLKVLSIILFSISIVLLFRLFIHYLIIKYVKPNYISKTIFDIDFNKLDKKYIFIDLDNTLVSPFVTKPDKKVIDLFNYLNDKNMIITILSNNNENRVKIFSNGLNVNYLFDVKKPNTKKLSLYIKDNNININNSLIIGDQCITDILLANRLNIDSILVNRLTNKDELITFIPRMIDKYSRYVLYKYNLMEKI